MGSLRQTAVQWENDGFENLGKEKCVKYKGQVVVPWIGHMNVCLVFISVLGLHFNFCFLTTMVEILSILHIIDNKLIYRATVRGFGKGGALVDKQQNEKCSDGKEAMSSNAESRDLAADVGVPVAHAVHII